jgi:uncharacterized protein (TIGR03083 family)
MSSDTLDDLDPFDIFDAEAARLDAFFSGLEESGWQRPSRCATWSVRDVLGHLAGEEMYNHACLDDDLRNLFDLLDNEGINTMDGFNDWSVRARRGVPVAEVLAEWRTKNGDTRRRMRELGRSASLPTMAGPYPVGLQAFHYCSEYATHADDVAVPVDLAEEPGRTAWRTRFGRFALEERAAPVQITEIDGHYRVDFGRRRAKLSPAEFVAATTGRLRPDHPLEPSVREALQVLA